MTDAPRITVLVAALAATLSTACGPQRVAGPSRPVQALPAQALVVLLPDANGSVGRARVTNESGSADLASARDATHVAASQPPGPIGTLSGISGAGFRLAQATSPSPSAASRTS